MLQIEGTLAYGAQNCQWLAHIPPMGFPWSLLWLLPSVHQSGADPGGRTRRAPPPLKLEKIWFFLRKIVIFHTKYPNNFRASLRSAQFSKCAPPNLKSWIRPCQLFEDCSHTHYPWDTPTDENLGGSSLVNALCGSTDEILGIIGTTQRYRSRWTVVPARWGPLPHNKWLPSLA